MDLNWANLDNVWLLIFNVFQGHIFDISVAVIGNWLGKIEFYV